MKSFDIVGYTYQGENFTPDNLIEHMIENQDLSPAARDMSVAEALQQLAGALAIDPEDESSYDSNDFPKVIFADSLDEDLDSDWYDFNTEGLQS